MSIIHSWKYNDNNGKYEISLFHDRIVIESYLNDSNSETVLNINDYLILGFAQFPLKIDYQILKKIVRLEKPKNLSVTGEMNWAFWQVYN